MMAEIPSVQIRELVGAAIAQEEARFRHAPEEPPADPIVSDSFAWDCMSANEDGDAALFIYLHRDRFVFDHAAGTWHTWAGQHWQEDVLGESLAAVEAVIAVYAEQARKAAWERLKETKAGNTEAAKVSEEREGKFLRRVAALQSLGRKRNILVLAGAGHDSLGVTGERWDGHPMLLACPNGTLDLETGKLRPGRPEEFLKTACPTPWSGLDARAPTWEDFLHVVFDGDRELIAYLRRLLGYGITGLTTEHIFPILWGVGRNGKSTLLQTLGDVLGPLAAPTKSELILAQPRTRSAASPDSDIMALRGRRLTWATESEEGRRFDAGRLKLLTGGDTLTGRPPYGKREITFQPTHLLMLLTNHRPKADPSDFALWQRLHLIPFGMSFVDEPRAQNERRRDPDLLRKLRGEGPGILAWLVRGAIEWRKSGLMPPKRVQEGTEAYRRGEDDVARFIDECCLTGAETELRVKAGELYGAYTRWAESNGLPKLGGRRFSEYIRARFTVSDRTRYGFSYLGIGLLETA